MTVSTVNATAPITEHVHETIKISHAEYVLIQELRKIKHKSLMQVDVCGDGRPVRIRVIENCWVDVT
jgi:hypothetical protein